MRFHCINWLYSTTIWQSHSPTIARCVLHSIAFVCWPCDERQSKKKNAGQWLFVVFNVHKLSRFYYMCHTIVRIRDSSRHSIVGHVEIIKVFFSVRFFWTTSESYRDTQWQSRNTESRGKYCSNFATTAAILRYHVISFSIATHSVVCPLFATLVVAGRCCVCTLHIPLVGVCVCGNRFCSLFFIIYCPFVAIEICDGWKPFLWQNRCSTTKRIWHWWRRRRR